MRFRISHETVYRYSAPVFLEAHKVRLRPRSDSRQQLRKFSMHLDPEPQLLTETVDAEGNDVAYAWFSEPTDRLAVKTDFEVETLRENPFDYMVIGKEPLRLPIEYPSDLGRHLRAAREMPEACGGVLGDFVDPLVKEENRSSIPFLTLLNEEIHQRFQVEVREHGDPLPPEETLRSERAACRDLAVLFMHCCRAVGFAARFVSGYQLTGHPGTKLYMHAWAEVYIPGGGWRAYDPTQGLSVADQHVAVAASADPARAAPISGTFRGQAIAQPMQFTIVAG